ncbi:MAG TPA: DUF3291 domain-containing protein [Allosphingosinicella sp.]|nr:DUF3291 domain-containing protein [Allosphingosinicella sp.]
MNGHCAVPALRHHLAQLNIARARYDFDSPEMGAFVRGVDLVNGAADRYPGMLWRLTDASGAMNRGPHPRDIVNLSVWESPEALAGFLRNTVHRHFVAQKGEWFHPPEAPHVVFWWVVPGERPTLEGGLDRLASLRARGSRDEAFDWAALKRAKAW